MWLGLAVLLDSTAAASSQRATPVVVAAWPLPPVHDPQLVRLLANMLLLTQSQVHYAY